MTDSLSISVPVPGRYPSINHTGRDGLSFGRKSKEYRALFDAVKEAAEAEMARTRWDTAQGECMATIVRFVPDRRRSDAANLAKCEWDALTAAGVWADDRLANPCNLLIRHDPKGEHRVSIVVLKLHEPATSIAPKSDAGPLSAVSGSSRRARPSSVQAAQLQSESEVMPNDGVPDLCNDACKRNVPRPNVASPREGARRVKSSKGVTEAALASWRPGDPWPEGYARLAGKWVRLEYAKDLIGR